MHLQKVISRKNCVKKLVFAGILKVNDENSRIRIQYSEAWIRGSGSGSTPKCHGSATLAQGLLARHSAQPRVYQGHPPARRDIRGDRKARQGDRRMSSILILFSFLAFFLMPSELVFPKLSALGFLALLPYNMIILSNS
jgi:hypothetical protein